MATNTPIYQFRKPVDADDVDPLTDLGNNWDKVEAALNGLNQVVTAPPIRGKWSKITGQRISSPTIQDVVFDIENADVGMNINIPFVNFSVPSNGLYAISFITGWDNITLNNFTTISILKNNIPIAANPNSPVSSANAGTTHSVAITDYFIPTDVMKITASSNGIDATLTTTINASSNVPTLTIVKVG